VTRTLLRVRGRRSSGTFFQVPHAAWRHPGFAALSAHALKLLIDIAGWYNGKNNGDLSATYSTLSRERCWKSRDTLHRALGELVRTGFLVRTRQGKRLCGAHMPSLYAVTWWPIDASDKHDMSTVTAPRLWLTEDSKPDTIRVLGNAHQTRPLDLGVGR